VKLADVIPWHVAETMYAKNFMSKRGAPALTVRMALGTLIIKETLGLSDIKTVEQIKENPYLQYFIGLESFQYEAPFDASMLTHFRKRLKHTDLAALQEELLQRHLAEERKRAEDKEENKGSSLWGVGDGMRSVYCWSTLTTYNSPLLHERPDPLSAGSGT